MLDKALRENRKVLFEGAQGTMLDIDMGTYPYVTSSNSSALGLSNGTGISPKLIGKSTIFGVSKAYVTRVGEGPFPTELKDEDGIITKLDVLDNFDYIKVCVAYEYEGKLITDFPASLEILENCKPVYKTLKGWNGSTKGLTAVENLPKEAREFIQLIEEETKTPVVMLSTGPERHQFTWLKEVILG